MVLKKLDYFYNNRVFNDIISNNFVLLLMTSLWQC